MKNLDALSKRIIIISLSLSLVILSAGFAISKINKTDHKNVMGRNTPTQVTSIGKYMMSYQAFVYEDGGTGYNILVWDTETGKARIYYYKNSESKMVHWSSGDLPANPLD